MGELVPGALDTARSELGLTWPIQFSFLDEPDGAFVHAENQTIGGYRPLVFAFAPTPVHEIKLARVGYSTPSWGTLTPGRVNESLWHELIHAQQAERAAAANSSERMTITTTGLASTLWDAATTSTFHLDFKLYPARTALRAWTELVANEGLIPYWRRRTEVEAREGAAARRGISLVVGSDTDPTDLSAFNDELERQWALWEKYGRLDFLFQGS